MELDIANAALELSVRFPADASDEALAIFVKTHTELTNRINEQRRKLNETVIKVVDSTQIRSCWIVKNNHMYTYIYWK